LSSAARRVLVDEDLSPRLALALAAELGEAIRCSSVRDEGWRGLKNRELLARMVERSFTILVTADRNVVHQQPLARLNLAAVVVTRPLQRAAVFARVTAIAEAVRAIQPARALRSPCRQGDPVRSDRRDSSSSRTRVTRAGEDEVVTR